MANLRSTNNNNYVIRQNDFQGLSSGPLPGHILLTLYVFTTDKIGFYELCCWAETTVVLLYAFGRRSTVTSDNKVSIWMTLLYWGLPYNYNTTMRQQLIEMWTSISTISISSEVTNDILEWPKNFFYFEANLSLINLQEISHILKIQLPGPKSLDWLRYLTSVYQLVLN